MGRSKDLSWGAVLSLGALGSPCSSGPAAALSPACVDEHRMDNPSSGSVLGTHQSVCLPPCPQLPVLGAERAAGASTHGSRASPDETCAQVRMSENKGKKNLMNETKIAFACQTK